ncbi:hypothetical protein ACSBOX_05955 [Arthrobacter sp. KN11-1C]|uniref:hypothetical protein n=1 Tax=Arthrobacter sp. KN11-1C TaxID=3445774 RepID=UPI003F9EE9C3
MRTGTGASFYYTADGLGSTILLTDSAQAAAATYSYGSGAGLPGERCPPRDHRGATPRRKTAELEGDGWDE